ncbi:DUF4339 domain-containing protein [Stratiformator vulcanicus]|uniref:GYF domain-containing protein n=1 Tax=Stratiformator vulcanicus TaxID=2527980 RepID=A0A517R6C1_9PLAN|nr:DUF4339 domain-containing protein [Stratiformator vulcanicus]QDT39437.1 hypothetical protein Pan189_38440 [Stratiformator vulcanicus]
MAAEWFIQENGKKVGPLTASQLKKLRESGRITEETLVRKGESKWRPAIRIAGMFPNPDPIESDSPPMAGAEPSTDEWGDGEVDDWSGGNGIVPPPPDEPADFGDAEFPATPRRRTVSGKKRFGYPFLRFVGGAAILGAALVFGFGLLLASSFAIGGAMNDGLMPGLVLAVFVTVVFAFYAFLYLVFADAVRAFADIATASQRQVDLLEQLIEER